MIDGRRSTTVIGSTVLRSAREHVEAEPDRHGICAGSKVAKVIGEGRRSAAARWIASTVRSGWVRPSSAARSRHRWSTGTTCDPLPVVAERPPELVGARGVVAEPVDEHQRLGQHERRWRTMS